MNVTSHTRIRVTFSVAGFALFLVLTLALIWTRPVPLALSSPKLIQVQDQLYQFARSNWDSAKSTWSNTRRLDRQLAAEGFSILPDVDSTAAAEARSFYDSRQFKRFDLKVSKKAAGLLNINWPVKRWPVYVFTIGAMACLLTSATCHLFGCCAAHVSRLIWRFDYLGIAVLIVCSFYPQVYYGELQHVSVIMSHCCCEALCHCNIPCCTVAQPALFAVPKFLKLFCWVSWYNWLPSSAIQPKLPY